MSPLQTAVCRILSEGRLTDKQALTLQTPESFRARFDIDVRVRNEVTAIHAEKKTVAIRNLETNTEYEESYDKLDPLPGRKSDTASDSGEPTCRTYSPCGIYRIHLRSKLI